MAGVFRLGDCLVDESTHRRALDQMYNLLPALIRESRHNEMWGIDFTNPDTSNRTAPRTIVLQKILRANKYDVTKAAAQFLTVLKWRREYNPRASSLLQTFERDKFGGIGYVTRLRSKLEGNYFVITWNLYDRVEDLDALFRDAARYVSASRLLPYLYLRLVRSRCPRH